QSPKYWYAGFLSLQSSIDAAIIEVVSNHSVWEEMKSIAGVRMKSRSVIFSITLEYSYFMITIVMCFSPFMYFLSMNVVREKKKLKVLMKTMGLQDIAFWLSWSLLYAVYVMVLSCLLTALVLQDVFYLSSFPAVLLLFFLYGLACVSQVLKNPKLAGSMGFLITFLFGCVSLAVLIENLPEPLKWFLGLFCPFAFNAGIAKVWGRHCKGMGHELCSKYGIPDPPFFCLKPSYWVRSRRGSTREMPRTTVSPEELLGDDVEPVPSEFMGTEAIRLRERIVIHAFELTSLSLNIYEGQITALLGHSGAGKTTLLNVLSGLTLPSEGSATIYNYKLSEIGDREEIREMIGICPQFNVHFEVLTVKENLKTFAEIKGIKSKDVEQEVQNILELLDISNIQDTQAEKLSGGQKRKLSIGIAMLGKPQVLFLDEPTAGLDPLSRHQVWSLLKEHRAGRVILFSTQFMDEADILADRKAFISHGRLKCVGSSLFLKKKWGIGYHLSESCDLENVTSVVKQYIPNVIFSGHSQYELRYKLPLENVTKFPDLFSGLDSCSDQGIINYGVSMTTLEDVFLRLEEATADREGTIMAPNIQSAAEENSYFAITPEHSVSAWELSSARYFLPLGKTAHSEMTSLLVHNNTGEGNKPFLIFFYSGGSCCWKGKQVKEQMVVGYKGSKGFFILFSCSLKSYRFTVLCHMEAINCFPVLVNVISNALLRALNSTVHIRIWSHPFFSINDPRFWDYFVAFYLIYMLLLFPGFPPHFAMDYMKDYKVGARDQLRVSGLFPSAYWCGQALVDIPLCWFLLFSMFGLQFAMSNKIMGTFGYGISIVLFIYLISFIFRKGWNCDFWSFILIVVSIWLNNWTIFAYCVFPSHILYHCHHLLSFSCSRIEGKAVNVATSFFQPYIHSVGFILLLRYLEIKYGRAVLRKDPIFSSHQHPEELEEEDEDVKAERAAVRNAIAALSQEEKSVIIVSNLCKEYKIKQAGSVFKKKKKMATKNISFCVKKGEVLGLLGPNGAGKSTAIKMITGETTLTAGQVLMKSGDGATSHLQDHEPAFLGYCPQEDPLWPNLTVHEHLRVYAAVKGVCKEDTAAAVNQIVNALQLQDYLKKKPRKLSAGITRKLCFAMCMLGNPTVLLLDEPSTGMDPNGQRCVWKTIRAALKTKETGALLTTHYMEEAEAVCDRVAIMVSGQLRCIGSIQYLKNKFGKGYLLEIKVKDPEHTDLLHAEILRIFPSAARQERFPSLLVYKVPMEDALPLSQSFSKLEEGKNKTSWPFEKVEQAANFWLFLFLHSQTKLQPRGVQLLLEYFGSGDFKARHAVEA
uniref:ABC transporter domain-containing protein n=1 Tax=Strix occidentalis caurina TaxID=311401 RepID=A0A8D0F2N8_STROC